MPTKTVGRKTPPFFYSFRDGYALFRLAWKRMDSAKDYQKFQRLQGELLVRYLEGHGVVLKGKRTLDLGCGYGGYSLALLSQGSEVAGVDLNFHPRLSGFPTICANAIFLPFKEERFDLVICASLIEHVTDPLTLLNEIYRVLRPEGRVYLSFPPFYSFWGGHQFSPFHFLGERRALKINHYLGRYKKNEWVWEEYPEDPVSFSKAYGDWGLYPLTIGQVEKWIKESPFELIEKSTRWSAINFARIPVLNEFLTWHVQFLLGKPDQ